MAAAAGLVVVAPLVLESAMADVVATLLTNSGSFWRLLLSFLWSGLFRETDSFLLLCDHHIALVVKEMTVYEYTFNFFSRYIMIIVTAK